MRVYLDHNATSPLRPEARAAMLAALDLAGNASSVHGEGRAARKIIEDARERVAAVFGAPPAGITFTSGGTESANWLLAPVNPEGVLYVNATEHACVLHGHRFPAEQASAVAIDAAGLVGACPAGRGDMIAVQAANNETGVCQPIAALAASARESGAFIVCDAVQAVGRTPVDPLRTVDAFFLSAHKFGGPKGAGAAVVLNDALRPASLIRGGGQEKRRRAGTENIPAIAGLAAALEAAAAVAVEFTERARAMQGRLEAGVRDIAPDAVIFGEDAPRLPNTTCFAIPGLAAETALIAFDLGGIAVSSGAACSSGRVERSHVLDAMGVPPQLAAGAIRVSSGWTTQGADIERFLAVLAKLCSNRHSVWAA